MSTQDGLPALRLHSTLLSQQQYKYHLSRQQIRFLSWSSTWINNVLCLSANFYSPLFLLQYPTRSRSAITKRCGHAFPSTRSFSWSFARTPSRSTVTVSKTASTPRWLSRRCRFVAPPVLKSEFAFNLTPQLVSIKIYYFGQSRPKRPRGSPNCGRRRLANKLHYCCFFIVAFYFSCRHFVSGWCFEPQFRRNWLMVPVWAWRIVCKVTLLLLNDIFGQFVPISQNGGSEHDVGKLNPKNKLR